MSRTPDYRLKALNKKTGSRVDAGAGWKNPDGSIFIAVSTCVVLTDNPDVVLTLFPVEKKEEKMP